MYVFNWSESNLFGRGDVAPERGLAGDLMPDNAELAMMKRDGRLRVSVVGGVVVFCLCLPKSVNSLVGVRCLTFPPSLEASCPPLLFRGNPLRHHHMIPYTHSHLIPMGSI
jgi:hypothetical protein